VTPALRVVAALDSFKGSVSSAEAGEAARLGILAAAPDADVVVVPVADGGEGTVAALSGIGRVGSVEAVDLFGRPIMPPHVVLPHGAVVIESASTAGIGLLPIVDVDSARRATTQGLGMQIAEVARAEPGHDILVGLGGTGCTDGGTGMLLALGARLWDAAGREITAADPHPLLARPIRVELPSPPGPLVGLADVDSPLLGPTGAAQMFAPQKGADTALVEELESAMRGWALALAEAGADVADMPGAGAAGGLGAAILALGGVIESGFTRLIREADVESAFARADLVLTGEGSIDAQTARGKVPDAAARLAHSSGRALVVALGGRVEPVDASFDAAFPIHSGPISLDRAMDPEVTRHAIADAAARVARLLIAARA